MPFFFETHDNSLNPRKQKLSASPKNLEMKPSFGLITEVPIDFEDQYSDVFPRPRAYMVSIPSIPNCICSAEPYNQQPDLLKLEEMWCRVLKRQSSPQGKNWYPSVFCVSLRGCRERETSCFAQFHKSGLCRLAAMFSTERPDAQKLLSKFDVRSPGAFGCGQSHKYTADWIARHLPLSKHENVMILEDDFKFLKGWQDHLPYLANFFALNEDQTSAKNWEIFFLGHFPYWGYPVHGLQVWRVWSVMTHAFLLSEKGRKHIQEWDHVSICREMKDVAAIDDWIRLTFTGYAYSPQFIIQNPKIPSQISKGIQAKDRKPWDLSIEWTQVHANALEKMGTFADLLMMIEIPLLCIICFILFLLLVSSIWTRFAPPPPPPHFPQVKTTLAKNEIF